MNTQETVETVLAIQRAMKQETAYPEPAKDLGQNIVVLDRGFVYVGDVTLERDFLRIERARNIRKWGTTKGLGELRNGPLSETLLDDCDKVLAPMKSLIHLIPCKGF